MEDWKTEAPSSYREDKFYTQASDEKGHSVPIHIRIPPDIYRRIEEVVSSRTIPDYKTMSDLVRDAIHHRLNYLAQKLNLEEVDFTLRAVRNLQRIRDIEIRKGEIMKTIPKMSEMILQYRREGAEEKAIELLEDLVADILGIKDKYWRKKLLSELELTHQELLDRLPLYREAIDE